MLLVLKTFFVLESKILISVVLDITILEELPSLSLVLTTFKSSISATPSNLDIKEFSSEIFPATPPTWKVLKVNWVPGSPIDWAATTPTASPIWTGFPVARFLP